MTINNEIIWNDAEKLAKIISESYKNIQQKGQPCEKQIADEEIKELKNCINKRRFIAICTNFSKFATKDDNLQRIMKDVLSLKSERLSDDKDISFEMFMTCLHLAFYKSKWSIEEQKEV